MLRLAVKYRKQLAALDPELWGVIMYVYVCEGGGAIMCVCVCVGGGVALRKHRPATYI